MDLIKRDKRLPIWATSLYILIGLVFGVLFTFLPLIGNFKENIIPLIDDPFAVAGLTKPVNWSGYEFLFGLVFLLAVLVSFLFLLKRRYIRSLITMAIGTSYVLMMYLLFVLPKIEAHTQGSLIDFFAEQKGKDVYVMTYGFHSYAGYYYFEQPNDNVEKRGDKDFLLNGAIDKPVLIVSKITDNRLVERKDIEVLGEEGGYRFYRRAIPQ